MTLQNREWYVSTLKKHVAKILYNFFFLATWRENLWRRCECSNIVTSKMELTKWLSHCKDPKSYWEGTKISVKCLRWQYKSRGWPLAPTLLFLQNQNMEVIMQTGLCPKKWQADWFDISCPNFWSGQRPPWLARSQKLGNSLPISPVWLSLEWQPCHVGCPIEEQSAPQFFCILQPIAGTERNKLTKLLLDHN